MFLVTIFYFTQLLLNLHVHAESPYCAHPCSGVPNTMCEYPEGGTRLCSGFKKGLSEKEKRYILDSHNSLRQRVALGKVPDQPSATNMIALVWDDEGAAIAQRWAEQCEASYKRPFEDKCRTKLNGEEGGQNLSVEMPESNHDDLVGFLSRRVNQWFLQGMNFNFKWEAEYSSSKNTGPYSQIVWAATTSLGCGLSYNCSTDESMYRFVCNYYPAGDVVGKMIYKKGLACTECPEGYGCSKTWQGLCTSVSEDMGGSIPDDAINTESAAESIHSSLILFTFSLMVYFLENCK